MGPMRGAGQGFHQVGGMVTYDMIMCMALHFVPIPVFLVDVASAEEILKRVVLFSTVTPGKSGIGLVGLFWGRHAGWGSP